MKQPFDHTNTLFEQIDQHLAQVRELNIAPARRMFWNSLTTTRSQRQGKVHGFEGLTLCLATTIQCRETSWLKMVPRKIIDLNFRQISMNRAENLLMALWRCSIMTARTRCLLTEEYLGNHHHRQTQPYSGLQRIGDIKWGLWGVIARLCAMSHLITGNTEFKTHEAHTTGASSIGIK